MSEKPFKCLGNLSKCLKSLINVYQVITPICTCLSRSGNVCGCAGRAASVWSLFGGNVGCHCGALMSVFFLQCLLPLPSKKRALVKKDSTPALPQCSCR